MIRYRWADCALEHDPRSGYTAARYGRGRWSGCGVVEGDRHHAPRLGVTPQRHRLVHELLHQIIARTLYGPGEGVVWRDAHHVPQERSGEVKAGWTEADREERIITAATYALYDRPYEAGARVEYEAEGHDWAALVTEARWLIVAADLGVREVVLETEPEQERAA